MKKYIIYWITQSQSGFSEVLFDPYEVEGLVSIGHFRVPPRLCFKTRVGAQSLIWKSFFILMQIKLILQERLCT